MYEITLAFSFGSWLAVCAFYMRSTAANVFHPFMYYALFHGLCFAIRPIVGYFYGYTFIYNEFQFSPTMSAKITAILAADLGFFVFAATSLYAGSIPMQFKRDQVVISERIALTPLFFIVAIICVPIGMYSFAHGWSGDSNAQMIRDKATGFAVNTSSNGYLSDAQLMLASCAALWGWLFRFRFLGVLPMVVFFVARAGTGGRGPFVTAAVSMALLWLYENRRLFPTPRVIVGVLIVAFVFNAVGKDRGHTVKRLLGLEDASYTSVNAFTSGSQQKPMEGEDLANMEFLEYIVWVVPKKSHTYSYFLDNLQVFTEPIPRALWKSKPIGAPFRFMSFFDFGRPEGMTMSLPGVGWYGLGWLGVIVICGAWGLALGRLYTRFVESDQNSLAVAAYMIFLPVLIIAYRDGQVMTIARQNLFFLMPILLWKFLATRTGIPTASEVRILLARRLARARSAAQADDVTPTADAAPAQHRQSPPDVGSRAMPMLSPAVLRRRIALLNRGADPQ